MKHKYPDKIIFLDIDGVINIGNDKWMKFSPACMERLEKILDATGASIVVSSSWRTDFEKMFKNFREHGCTEKIIQACVGITTRGYHHVKEGSSIQIVRGNEIKHWVDRFLVYPWHSCENLKETYSVYTEDGSFKMMDSNKKGIDFQYIILDDDTDMLYEQRNNFLWCNSMRGITEGIVKKAIKILNYK